MLEFIKSSEYDYTLVENEVNNLPSETIPDQSYTLKELLERFTRGQDISDTNRSIYYDADYPEEDVALDNLMHSPDFDLADATLAMAEYNARFSREDPEQGVSSPKDIQVPESPKNDLNAPPAIPFPEE